MKVIYFSVLAHNHWQNVTHRPLRSEYFAQFFYVLYRDFSDREYRVFKPIYANLVKLLAEERLA